MGVDSSARTFGLTGIGLAASVLAGAIDAGQYGTSRRAVNFGVEAILDRHFPAVGHPPSPSSSLSARRRRPSTTSWR